MIKTEYQMQNRLDAVDQMVVLIEASVNTDLQDIGLMGFSICVSEALTNLVQHSNSTDKSVPIDILISKNDELIHVEIFDPIGAKYFNPLENVTTLENVDAMSEGGRGIGMLLEFSDEIEYGPVNAKNRLKLTFLRDNDN